MSKMLQGQCAVISGGTSGIGKEMAKVFLESGATVVILGSNPEKGQQALEELKQVSQTVHFIPVDVSQKAACADLIATVEKEIAPIDILVNNAGITRDGLFMKMSEEDWDRTLEVNLKSVYNLSQPLCRPMMKRRKGVILNISSVGGLTGNAGQVNYAASKAGMIGATKALAKELASRGIRVNCIAPGYIKTAMTEVLNESQKEAIFQGIPMRRIAEPREVANAALFLVSDLASYVTGQVLVVDGGMVM